MTESHFTKLAAIDVSAKIEKKQNLSYLSWAWAVDQLLRNDSNATWSYGDPVRWGDTVMVFCTVTAFGKQMTSQLPVMDHRNKAIPNPDAFQVNTAMQRCLVKAIALHGLGLYIYAGEDLPQTDEPAGRWGLSAERADIIEKAAHAAVTKFKNGNEYGAYEEVCWIDDNEEKLALWSILKKHSALRSCIKKHIAAERAGEPKKETANV